METHFRNSFISLSNVNVVCRHLLFNFQSLFMKCMVRIINESMLMLDHISVLAEKKSLSCSSAMMIYLIFLNNWGMTLTFVLLGNSYCLSNDWSISLKAGFSAVRSGAFSTTKYFATFLINIFHLSLSRFYLASFKKASLIPTWPAGLLHSQELEDITWTNMDGRHDWRWLLRFKVFTLISLSGVNIVCRYLLFNFLLYLWNAQTDS